jgi:hypothetical protein
MIRHKPDDGAELILAETLSAARRTARAHAGLRPSRGHQLVLGWKSPIGARTGADPKQPKESFAVANAAQP